MVLQLRTWGHFKQQNHQQNTTMRKTLNRCKGHLLPAPELTRDSVTWLRPRREHARRASPVSAALPRSEHPRKHPTLDVGVTGRFNKQVNHRYRIRE